MAVGNKEIICVKQEIAHLEEMLLPTMLPPLWQNLELGQPQAVKILIYLLHQELM
jgi:hypothetical protein